MKNSLPFERESLFFTAPLVAKYDTQNGEWRMENGEMPLVAK
jgi:hypothetical protein